MGSNSYTVYPITVVAGGTVYYASTFNNIAVLESSLTNFNLGIDDDNPEQVFKGFQYRTEGAIKAKKFSVQNTTSSSLTVTIATANGQIDDKRLIVQSGSLVNSKSGDTLLQTNVSIGTSAAIIKAANTSRTRITVTNNHATNILYVGSSTVTTSDGTPIQPGGSISMDTGADVYGIASGASTDVRVLAESV